MSRLCDQGEAGNQNYKSPLPVKIQLPRHRHPESGPLILLAFGPPKTFGGKKELDKSGAPKKLTQNSIGERNGTET